MQPGISAIIINYNTKHLLKTCVDSLLQQTHKNLQIIFIDNLSQDGSCEFVQQNYHQVIAVCNNQNIGYADAGNQGIRMAVAAKRDYVMLLNPDIIFEPDYMEKCIAKMEEDKKLAAICGKIHKYDFSKNEKTNFIDTAGLFCFRNRRVIDDGQGLEDKGQFDIPKEVFGISGACPIYRTAALEDAKIMDEYLDSDFFMYKEDVDISWRFLLLGWKNYYLPTAKAYHGRGTGVLKRFTHMEVFKNRSKLNAFQKHYSYKNQRLMQVKNEFFMGYLHDFFPMLWKEILVFGYMIFREPFLFKSWWLMMKQMPRALKKRKIIASKRKVGWKEMEHWLAGKQSEYLKYDLEHPTNSETPRDSI